MCRRQPRELSAPDPGTRAAAEKGAYQRVGEATEVALRVLAEKVGLPGYAGMPGALAGLARQDRATFCNDHWQRELHKARRPAPRARR